VVVWASDFGKLLCGIKVNQNHVFVNNENIYSYLCKYVTCQDLLLSVILSLMSVIHIVMKYSDDGGDLWSLQRYEIPYRYCTFFPTSLYYMIYPTVQMLT
jgi:hypothetical protein